jgi:hypothetical protein
MAKIFKIIGRTLGISLEWILILFTAFAFLIRTSPVQTYLASIATDFLSKELNTTIKVNQVAITFFDRVALDGVFALDQNNDTLAYIETLHLNISKLDLKNQEVTIDNASLEGGNIHISRKKKDGVYNFQFIIDYFDSGKPKTKSEPFLVYVDALSLDDINFRYDDYRKGYNEYGVDFDHIHLQKLYLEAEDFNNEDGLLSFAVNELHFNEKSGFNLSQLSGKAQIGEPGILISNLIVRTDKSDLTLPQMHLLMHGLDDLQSFEDSVKLDIILDQSTVSMKDVSFFAYALEGMDEQVLLKGEVKDKIDGLKIRNLDLKVGKKTRLMGDLNLPDFKNFKHAFFNERLDYAYVDLNDLKKIRMPKIVKDPYLDFDKYVTRLGHFEARNVNIDGFYKQFVVASSSVKTDLGEVKLDNGILFTANPKNNSFFFERSEASDYDVKVESFDLGTFLDDRNFGIVDGLFFLSGEAFSLNKIKFNLLEGDVNRFDFYDYQYSDILISEGSFVDNIFMAKIDVKDDNLNLIYNGYIDLNADQHMRFEIDLTKAILDNLNVTDRENCSLTSSFTVDIFGKDLNKMSGSVTLDGLLYREGKKEIKVPSLVVKVTRSDEEDVFTLNSAVGDFELKGKIDFSTIITDFTHQFDQVFPGLLGDTEFLKKKKVNQSRFTYNLTTNRMDEFLSIFVPDLKLSPGTKLMGTYDGRMEEFSMLLTSKTIGYQDFVFEQVDLSQYLTSNSIDARYSLLRLDYGDSISIDNVLFTTSGEKNILESELTWNPNQINASDIKWQTIIVDNSQVNLLLEPSFFSLNKQRWDIEKASDMSVTSNDLHISKLVLKRGRQFISLDGCISRNDADKMNFRVHEVDLNELGTLVGSPIKMNGLLNGWGNISNPYTNLHYMGDASIFGLFLNDQEVGDIFVQSQWNKGSESIGMTGDLMYRGNQTFAFQGSYFTERKDENLEFDLLFDNTDIQFTSAFLDPDIVNNIRGQLNGSLSVSGTPDFPKLDGRVKLNGGNAKIEILGVNFGFDGEVIADEYGFYINNMPVSDEEGNTGSLIGSVYHEQYEDWNFDIQIELEGNTFYDADAVSFGGNGNSSRFLVMNTKYKDGEYYYGKAYASGYANIFGYTDNLEITVDMRSLKGTSIYFPMYGAADIDEDDGLITFISKDSLQLQQDKKIDFTGVSLDLNFKVTPDANMKIIFNDQTGDEIAARGSGDINIKLDNLGELILDGTYKVKDGVYNFTMGPIKQPFYIQEGGTIAWTGDPYNANLDMKTYTRVNANLSELSPDELQGSSSGSNQEILCYLSLTESLLKPNINFDIKAPKSDETGRTLLNRVTSDKDELNRQFFSLMLWKKFQPLKGTSGASGSAALDLVANQINSLLSSVSKDYKMNVNLDNDLLTGGSSMEFGVSKSFLDNRLIVTGSFGVENNSTSGDKAQGGLMGDVEVEYLLNESGSFRVNVFNESNDQSVIQDKDLGPFTQGAGIHYSEDFDNIHNFKLIQYFLDIFRSAENKRFPVKRNKQTTPIPPESSQIIFVLPRDQNRG